MTGQSLHREDWSLEEATAADIEALMGWFPEQQDVVIWGGPTFRYPFTRATFFKDVHWQAMPSFSLFDSGREFVGFGQLYDRDGRIHLARLVVRPDKRGQGAGRRLIEMLIDAGAGLFPGEEYSLFVFRKNTPALECYKALGFNIARYPDDMPHADVCYYLVRTAKEY